MPKKRRSVLADNARRERPPIICPHCSRPIVPGRQIGPLFAANFVKWDAHPVLSKPVAIRGQIFSDSSSSRGDLSVGEQLRQRAAMGGERERAEVAAFEKIWTDAIAAMLVEEFRNRRKPEGA